MCQIGYPLRQNRIIRGLLSYTKERGIWNQAKTEHNVIKIECDYFILICFQIEDFTARLNTLQESLKEKTGEVKMMQSELKLVKEFRRKRGQMQKELDEVSIMSI